MSLEKARKIHAKRSQRAKTIDLKKQHNKQLEPTEENVSRWSKNPRRSDIIGVDDKSVIVAKKAAPKAKPKKATPKKAEPKKEAVRRPKAAPKKDMESWEELTKPVKKYDQWQFPSDEELKKEFYIEHELKGKKIFKDEKEFVGFTKKYGKSLIIGEAYDKTIANRTRTSTPQALMSILKTYKSWPEFRNEKTTKNLYRRFQQNLPLDMPIVIREKSGYEKVFSGNTRMDVAFQLGVEPKIIVLKLEQLEQYRKEQKEGEGLKAMPKDTSYTKRKETAEKLGKPSVVNMTGAVPEEEEEQQAQPSTIVHSGFQANQIQKFIDETDMDMGFIGLKNRYQDITDLLKELDSGKQKKTKKFLEKLAFSVELYTYDLLKLVDDLKDISIGQGLKMSIALQLTLPERAREGSPMMKYIAYDPMRGFIIDDRVEPNDQVEISKVFYSILETYKANKGFGDFAKFLNKPEPVPISTIYDNLESIWSRFIDKDAFGQLSKFYYKGVKKPGGGQPYHVYFAASQSRLVMLTAKSQPKGLEPNDEGVVLYDPATMGTDYKIKAGPSIMKYYGTYVDEDFPSGMGSYDFMQAIIARNCLELMKKYGLYMNDGDRKAFLLVGSDGEKMQDGQPKISHLNLDYYLDTIESILDLGNNSGLGSWAVFRKEGAVKTLRVRYGDNYFIVSPIMSQWATEAFGVPAPLFANQAILAESQYVLDEGEKALPAKFLKSINQVKKASASKAKKVKMGQAADVTFKYGKVPLGDYTNQAETKNKEKKLIYEELLEKKGVSEVNTPEEKAFIEDVKKHYGSTAHKSKFTEEKWRQLADLKEENPAVLDPAYNTNEDRPPIKKVYRAGTFKFSGIPTKGWKKYKLYRIWIGKRNDYDEGEYYVLDFDGIVEESFQKTLLSMTVNFRTAESFFKGSSENDGYLGAIVECETEKDPNLLFSFAHSNLSSMYREYEVVHIGNEFLASKIFVRKETIESIVGGIGKTSELGKWAKEVQANATEAKGEYLTYGPEDGKGTTLTTFQQLSLAKGKEKATFVRTPFRRGGKVKKYMRGGETVGPSHERGGIPAVNNSTGQMLELEGGEGIINKAAMDSQERVNLDGKSMTICEATSDLNQRAGNGKPMNCS